MREIKIKDQLLDSFLQSLLVALTEFDVNVLKGLSSSNPGKGKASLCVLQNQFQLRHRDSLFAEPGDESGPGYLQSPSISCSGPKKCKSVLNSTMLSQQLLLFVRNGRYRDKVRDPNFSLSPSTNCTLANQWMEAYEDMGLVSALLIISTILILCNYIVIMVLYMLTI